EGVNRLAKNGGAADSGKFASRAQSACDFGCGDFNAKGTMRLDFREFAERIRRAVGDELAIINVGNVTATFGFVHVVCGDEESDPVRGELEEKIPQLAPRDGIDARSRFVEKKEFWFVQHSAA